MKTIVYRYINYYPPGGKPRVSLEELIRLQAEKLNDPELKALLDKFQIQGLPALIFLKSK